MPVSTSSFVLLLSYRILSSTLIFGSLLSGIFPFIVSWIIQLWTLTIDSSIKGFPGGSDGKESSCNVGDLSSIPGLGRSPGEGHGNTLQYSCLVNSMDRGSHGSQRVGHNWEIFTFTFLNQKWGFLRSQDGEAIGRGDHFLFYKFIERTTER